MVARSRLVGSVRAPTEAVTGPHPALRSSNKAGRARPRTPDPQSLLCAPRRRESGSAERQIGLGQPSPRTTTRASSSDHISSAVSLPTRRPSRCTSTAPNCSTNTHGFRRLAERPVEVHPPSTDFALPPIDGYAGDRRSGPGGESATLSVQLEEGSAGRQWAVRGGH